MIFRRLIRTIAIVIFAALAICGSASAQTQTPSQRLQLQPCRLQGWNEDVRCGTYEVFEDRRAKTGRKIALKVVVLPALSEKPAPDPIFYFAGGPGGSAVEAITKSGKSYLSELRRDRDLVFVDQRGTGSSNPLGCNLHSDKNDLSAYFSEIFSLDRLRDCRAELEKKADLKLYSTSMAMDDLDEVRSALGYEKINLYGGSYGSTAALVYLRQYPQHVRTATVLGVAPPDLRLPLPFARGVQNATDKVFADCAADEKCHAEFPNLKADLESALARLDKEAAQVDTVNPFTRQPQRMQLTRTTFIEITRALLYQPEFARWLPLIIHQSGQGNFSLFVAIGYQIYRSIDDQIYRGMHFSVVCGEDLAFVSDAEYAKEAAGSFYGDGRLKAYRKACEIWPTAKIQASFVSPVKSNLPVLLITGEADPVTPPWVAEAAAKHLSQGRHITVPHTGHAFSFPCVENMIAEFIAKGSAKELDPSCLSQIQRPPFISEEMLARAARNQTESQPASENEQVWQGVLDVGQAKLRLVLHLSKTADGKLTGKLDSPDQGANGLPINAVSLQDQKLKFEMQMIGATYEGKISEDGTAITGEWQQQGHRWPLNLKRADKEK